MKLRILALLAVTVMLGGCPPGSGGGVAILPKSEVFVLVDLSETWHFPAAARRNEKTLVEIGSGIADVAQSTEPPVSIQYQVIGAGSLGKEPICDALYKPSMVAIRTDRPDYLVTKAKSLRQYLSVDCPALIIRQPPEPLTEISATVASVAETPISPGARRYMIIASDFLEETSGNVTVPIPSLKGVRVLLVYRPLAADQTSPADLQARVQTWKRKLEAAGATVTTSPDTALRRATITAFLSRR